MTAARRHSHTAAAPVAPERLRRAATAVGVELALLRRHERLLAALGAALRDGRAEPDGTVRRIAGLAGSRLRLAEAGLGRLCLVMDVVRDEEGDHPLSLCGLAALSPPALRARLRTQQQGFLASAERVFVHGDELQRAATDLAEVPASALNRLLTPPLPHHLVTFIM